jgi:hypothetical protein
LFAACEQGVSAERVLTAAGLHAAPPGWIDKAARVSLQVFAAKPPL